MHTYNLSRGGHLAQSAATIEVYCRKALFSVLKDHFFTLYLRLVVVFHHTGGDMVLVLWELCHITQQHRLQLLHKVSLVFKLLGLLQLGIKLEIRVCCVISDFFLHDVLSCCVFAISACDVLDLQLVHRVDAEQVSLLLQEFLFYKVILVLLIGQAISLYFLKFFQSHQNRLLD